MISRQEMIDKINSLPPRQKEVMRFAIDGHSLSSTAKRMGISIKGVEKSRQRIWEKLGVESEGLQRVLIILLGGSRPE